MNGGGTGMVMMDGQYAEATQACRELLRLTAITVASDYASDSREDLNALIFATVVDCMLIANV